MFDVFKKMLRASVGLVIAGFGIYLTMQANIGLAPWDALNQGIADMLGTSFGNVSVAIAFIVICIDLLLKEHIGYGTVLDAVIVGKAVDLFNYIDFIPVQHSLVTSIPLLIVGLFVISFAIYCNVGGINNILWCRLFLLSCYFYLIAKGTAMRTSIMRNKYCYI